MPHYYGNHYYGYNKPSVPVTVEDEEPFAEPPKEIRNNFRLYPFQLQSLNRMLAIEANPRLKLKSNGNPFHHAGHESDNENAGVAAEEVEEVEELTGGQKAKPVENSIRLVDDFDDVGKEDEEDEEDEDYEDDESEEEYVPTKRARKGQSGSTKAVKSKAPAKSKGKKSKINNSVTSSASSLLPFFEEKQPTDVDPNPTIESRVGILANKPGSGKSAVVLSLCSAPCSTKNEMITTTGNLYYRKVDSLHTDRANKAQVVANLIICNPKLLMQWAGYMKDFNYPAYVITNKTKIPNTYEDFVKICKTNRVIFLSSASLQGLTSYIDRIWFDRIFIDEIDSMEFPGCSGLKFFANFIWWVSATPLTIMSNIGCNRRGVGAMFKEYLVTMTCFHQITDSLRLFTVRCSDEEIDACIALPPYTIEDIFVPQSTALRLTQGIIEDQRFQNFLRGDRLDQAISLLNGTGTTTIATLAEAATAWMDANITNLQAELEYVQKTVMPIGSKQEEQKLERMASIAARLHEAERKKGILLERIAASTDCMICCDGLTNPVATKCCTQAFCVVCIKAWLAQKPSCPNCRARLDESKDFLVKAPEMKKQAPVAVDDEGSSSANATTEATAKKEKGGAKKRKAGDMLSAASAPSSTSSSSAAAAAATVAVVAAPRERPRTKIAALLQVLENSQRSLIYIECVGDDTTTRIKASLEEKGIKVLSLAGHTATTCMKIIEQLREATTKTCLMVSSIQHSAGFNLQFVDTIVMYQRMGDRETQIIGRGMRPGRTEPLKVYRILYQAAE
jgi:hypothetical protein